MEKILVLVSNSQKAQDLQKRLKKWGVDVVDVAVCEDDIALDELSARYNIIVISPRFCGDILETAKYVRRIRKVFFDPMIAIRMMFDYDNPLPLKIAGCNFVVYSTNWDEVWTQVCDIVQEISVDS